MTTISHATTPQELGLADFSDLFPERRPVIGEFTPAYDALRAELLRDLAPATSYELVLAHQIVDLNWTIRARASSANVELATKSERALEIKLTHILERQLEREYNALLREFEAQGGDEEDFDDPIDWDQIDRRIGAIMEGLKSRDPAAYRKACAEATELGVDPQLALSAQYLDNAAYRRHAERLPDLEKRLRLLSQEYREVQRARPIEAVALEQD